MNKKIKDLIEELKFALRTGRIVEAWEILKQLESTLGE